MAQGRVQINNLNLGQGSFPSIEYRSLHIGTAPAHIGEIIAVDTQTDFDELLGAQDSDLKKQLVAAQLNGGQNWFAYIAPVLPDADIETVIEQANDEGKSVELIFVYIPQESKQSFEKLHNTAKRVLAKYGRQVAIIAAAPKNIGMTWAEYDTAMGDLVEGLAANRVCVVPQIHGNNLGVLAGRLCNRAFSVADSPMRVESGSLLGLGETPKDKEGVPLPSSILTSLDSKRLSCPQYYPDFEGVYWGDANMLETKAGDFQVLEHLRVVMKAARAIRILAIRRIANRRFNSTPISIESNKTYFTRPLREMSKVTEFAGEVFISEIKPPKDDAIEITWHTNSKVELFFKVCPYASPKDITANIILDLALGDK